MNQAIRHCKAGLGIWAFASNDIDNNPDLVLACAGDTPTLEVMASTSILRKYLPNLKVRVVNIVDLMKLEANHPHGLSDTEYNYIFTKTNLSSLRFMDILMSFMNLHIKERTKICM